MSDACSGVLPNSGPAPPPPPPPPAVGQVPALRISTASELGPRKGAGGGQQQQQQQQEGYEPPAAIQNAMMTKDKKPFTYTPGMGGKLDLSQIRSPRMARRVAKNANDEGIEGPAKVLDQEPTARAGSSTAAQPSMYSQPQVAVAVFPQGAPQLASVNLRNSCAPRKPVADRPEQQQQPARPMVRLETRPPADGSQQRTPTPPTSPTQVTLAKAPTPWMQRQTSKEQELPEWAKRSSNRSCSQESTASAEHSPQQPRQIVFANPPSPPINQPASRPARALPAAQQPNVPRRIEDRPSVFTAINEPGHHQFVNSNPHHMSRWGNPIGQSAYQPQGAAYIVPLQVDSPTPIQQQQYQQNNHYNQNQMQYKNAPDNRNVQRVYAPMANQQPEPGPLQSQSFRVLQKITDTYNPDQVDGEQLRKLQLTEDDRYLMNKFKEQVDGEQYLHQEEDPRYRGAAIPSRAFRYLQTMTDSADVPNSTSRPVNSVPKKPNRNSNTFEEVPMQPYIPASQQQVQEPKKYTGGAIPSRSFRILQQMTTPESIAIELAQETGRDSTTTQLFNMPFYEQGYPWRCDSSTTDQSEGRPVDPTSSSFLDDNCENAEQHNDSLSEKCNEEEEENSSDSSCDSESYWAYSTGLNPLNRREETATRENIEQEANDSDEEDGDSTDCERVSLLEEDSDTEKNEVEGEKEDEEEDGGTTVSVNLPLRFKYSVSDEDVTRVVVGGINVTENDVETCVDFTLKRVASREIAEEKEAASPLSTPKFIVVTTSEAMTITETAVQPAEEKTKDEDEGNKEFLQVRENAREEITDDEDSGVTSDVSRIISEADTDSECYLQSNAIEHDDTLPTPVTRTFAKRKKYERTQTHSRLFKLLSDEQLLSSSQPTATVVEKVPPDQPILSTNSLPPRAKSLDCEALFGLVQTQSYDHTCTTSPTYYSALPRPQIYPRRNVYCPRTNSAKNIPRIFALKNQQMQSCMRSSNHGNTTAIPSNIPTPIRLNRRC